MLDFKENYIDISPPRVILVDWLLKCFSPSVSKALYHILSKLFNHIFVIGNVRFSTLFKLLKLKKIENFLIFGILKIWSLNLSIYVLQTWVKMSFV